ncbi:NYN domain-containing protein [Devosia beringensis]|uniref:NYN domain-containing protein n=1 Tax=Devosia beringensis TaxID=2657486 RepID=UPI00186BB129|nr:NYN domain-containing protein [Devosia beringensis]
MGVMYQALTRLRALATEIVGLSVPRRPRLAIFIDGDSVAPKEAKKVLDDLSSQGRLCVLRAYGNYTGRAAEGWTRLIRHRGIVARHMPSIVPGKNAADIALAIDAVELLLTRNIDTYVLVVSDADFTPLVRRLGESGKDVIVYGNRSTPEALRRACAAFHDIASLAPPAAPKAPSAPLWSLSPIDAEDIVLAALSDLAPGDDPVSMQALGDQIALRQPGFDSRTYRRRTLSALLGDLSSVTLVHQNGNRYASRLRLGD